MAVAARRERERTARREAILDAAQELIAYEGYHGIRMDAVADAAELSKGTLYLYFENKDALCAAVATRLLDSCIPRIEGAINEAPSGLDAVRRCSEAYYDFTQENPHHFRFALAWLSAGRTHGRLDRSVSDVPGACRSHVVARRRDAAARASRWKHSSRRRSTPASNATLDELPRHCLGGTQPGSHGATDSRAGGLESAGAPTPRRNAQSTFERRNFMMRAVILIFVGVGAGCRLQLSEGNRHTAAPGGTGHLL